MSNLIIPAAGAIIGGMVMLVTLHMPRSHLVVDAIETNRHGDDDRSHGQRIEECGKNG